MLAAAEGEKGKKRKVLAGATATEGEAKDGAAVAPGAAAGARKMAPAKPAAASSGGRMFGRTATSAALLGVQYEIAAQRTAAEVEVLAQRRRPGIGGGAKITGAVGGRGVVKVAGGAAVVEIEGNTAAVMLTGVTGTKRTAAGGGTGRRDAAVARRRARVTAPPSAVGLLAGEKGMVTLRILPFMEALREKWGHERWRMAMRR